MECNGESGNYSRNVPHDFKLVSWKGNFLQAQNTALLHYCFYYGLLFYLVIRVYLLGHLSYFPTPSALNNGCMTGAGLGLGLE